MADGLAPLCVEVDSTKGLERQVNEEVSVMSRQRKVLVTGAGGFIGHHLTTLLKHQGYWVRGWI